MSSFLLFSNNPRSYGLGAVTFDLLLGETHTFNNRVTDYSVEDGGTISDHIQNDLEQGSFTGLFSNFSLLRSTALNTAQDAFDRLFELWKKRELVTITTLLKVYEDMAITSVSMGKSAEDGESLTANISFRKVNTVKLQEIVIEAGVQITDLNSNLNRQIAPGANLGTTVGG
jgi:hypothetical protein